MELGLIVPGQNFLNYPAASRNNSSDSNSVVYEAGPTSLRQTNRDKIEENATEQEKMPEEMAEAYSRSSACRVRERVFLKFDSARQPL